jgi:hypothetical protein
MMGVVIVIPVHTLTAYTEITQKKMINMIGTTSDSSSCVALLSINGMIPGAIMCTDVV